MDKETLEKQKPVETCEYPLFTFDDVLALQCCMEIADKVQKDKELYEQLQSLHDRVHDAYHLEKQKPSQKMIAGAAKEAIFPEQKSAEWSEEDEVVFEDILLDLADRREMFKQKGEDVFAFNTQKEIAWLKSLKDRVQPQPKQEWSEEDEQCLQKAIECTFGNGYLSVSSWLKSFKDRVSQPHWKPSEKEIITLSSLLNFDYSMEHRETYRTIDNLYNELKILRDYD